MKIIPTLFIALGGTGAEIALRLRRHILSHVWGDDDNPVHLDSLDDFPLAQFIYYDLDASYCLNNNPNIKRIAESVQLTNLLNFSEEEKIISKLEMDKYLRSDGEINKYQHISLWFPLTRKRVLDLCIAPGQGTGQLRWLSRLYFFDKYQHLKCMIEGKIDSLLCNVTSRANLERLGVETEPASLRIVVISSTSGGTGSGAFIDMGYLSKWLATRRFSDATKVNLSLMLPSGYLGHGKSSCEANTYAALMELETCMRLGGQFVKGWGNGEYQDLPCTPYDDVFLFDSVNLAQKTAKAVDLYDMVADTLFEDFIPSDYSSRKSRNSIHQMQWKLGSFSPPVDSQKYGSMKMKYSKAYSAFGHSVIETQIEQSSDEISSCGQVINSNSLIAMLEAMDPSARGSLFQNCLESAMPWVELNVNGLWTVNPDQYMCVVGVDGAALFAQKFGEEFKSAVPARAGMAATKINFYESGIPGKLACYVELSGIPLTALTLLLKWRESYEEENKRFPVHIHKDRSLFVHPQSPTSATLDRLAEHFKLFIQGIVLGVLKQRRNDSENLDYCLSVSGEELSIGNERLIRLDGMTNEVQNIMQNKVANTLDQFKAPAQYASLVALYDFYAQCIYPPAIVRNEYGADDSQESFPHVMCCKLGEEAQKTLKDKYPDEDIGLIVRLKGYSEEEPSDNFDALDIWTDVIEGSETDVYAYEVGKAHRPKRTLKPEFFQSGWLESRLKIGIEKPEEQIRVAVPQVESGSRGNFCSSCGEQVNGNPKFCPHCGNQMKSGEKCSGCDCAIVGNPKFCPECGAKQGGGLQCSGCGCSIEGNPKFCQECGQSFHVGAYSV